VVTTVLVSVAKLEEGQRRLETKVDQIINVMDNKNKCKKTVVYTRVNGA